MANVYDPNLEEDEEEQGNSGQTADNSSASTPQTVSSGESATVQTSGAAPSVPSANKGSGPTGSGRFLNIQKYLKANEGVDYASKIGQNVQKQAQELGKGISSAQQNIASQVNPELQRLQGAIGTGQQPGFIQQTVQGASETGNLSQQAAQEYAKLYGGDYLKNLGIQNESQLASQQAKIAENANLAQTEQGRFQLLRNALGGQNYTRGQTSLDQLLLQGQSGQLKNLGETTSQLAKQSGADLQGLKTNVAEQGGQIAQLGQQAQQLAQQKAQEASQAAQQDIQNRIAQETQKRQSSYDQAVSELTNTFNTGGNISAQTAQMLGIAPQGLKVGSMLKLGDVLAQLQKSDQQVTKANVFDESGMDKARFNALSQLAQDPTLAQYVTDRQELGNAASFNAGNLNAVQAQRVVDWNNKANQVNFDGVERNPDGSLKNITIKEAEKLLEKVFKGGVGFEGKSGGNGAVMVHGITNTAMERIFNTVNNERKKSGLPPLQIKKDKKGKEVGIIDPLKDKTIGVDAAPMEGLQGPRGI